jgi:hypothetical protein
MKKENEMLERSSRNEESKKGGYLSFTVPDFTV